jgi:hypothetical protein
MPTTDEYVAACDEAKQAFARFLALRLMIERLAQAMLRSPKDAYDAITDEWPAAPALREIIENASKANMKMHGLWNGMTPNQQSYLKPPLAVPGISVPD